MLRTLLPLALATLASPALAEDWVIDMEASQVGFRTEAFGGTTEGEFERYQATIRLDPADLSAAMIDAEVFTVSGATGNGQIDQSMLADDGLAPEAHPIARFVSNDIRSSDNGYDAHGTLSIRGVDQAVILPFSLEISEGRAVAEAEMEIARLDFGVGSASWGDTAAQVTIILHIEADAAQ